MWSVENEGEREITLEIAKEKYWEERGWKEEGFEEEGSDEEGFGEEGFEEERLEEEGLGEEGLEEVNRIKEELNSVKWRDVSKFYTTLLN